MIEYILYSALGTVLGIFSTIFIIGGLTYMRMDHISEGIENKVDQKVEEKSEEFMGSMFS